MVGDERRNVGLVVDNEDAMGHDGLFERAGERSPEGSCTRLFV
jgi:hypothetical protein